MAETGEQAVAMTPEEAVRWLRDVDGELYRTKPGRRGREAWVAVVRAPRAVAPTPTEKQNGRLIVALGETLQEATSAAATQWREAFREVGPLH